MNVKIIMCQPLTEDMSKEESMQITDLRGSFALFLRLMLDSPWRSCLQIWFLPGTKQVL